MSANFDDLRAFRESIANFDVETYNIKLVKEITARLLQKAINRTPSVTGTLRRGWTAGQEIDAFEYVKRHIEVIRNGKNYMVVIKNPVEYAIYVEYGHRTPDHRGWVEGQFILTTSENELRPLLPEFVEEKVMRELERLL